MQSMVGKILHIDLGKQTSWEEFIPKDHLRKYLGGRGVNAKLLWDAVKPGTDPLGPGNPLIFGTGLFSGTAAPSSGRTTVTCLSPATKLYLKTNVGGGLGVELKCAGYGHIVVHGKADHPVYVWIDDAAVMIRDARHLWGLDVRKTDTAIKQELGDEDVQVAAIGPAGEKMVKFAAVMVSVYHAAGRGGAGAVMGSKNLKAVAVRGSGELVPANPARYHEAVLKARSALMSESGFEGLAEFGTAGTMNSVNEMRILPAYNFQRSWLENVHPLTGHYLKDGGYLKRRVACGSCIIGCHRYSTVDKGAFAGCFTGGPEYENLAALGIGCGVTATDAVIKANELCNIYGMDTISIGSVIQWAMECYERGVLSRDTLGAELRFGDGSALLEMVKKIAFRSGFGDVLAEGVKLAAEAVGGDSYKWAVHGKGLEQSRVDTRSAKAYALAFAVNPRGADHLHTQCFAEFGLSPESRSLIKNITGDEKFASPYLTEKRAEIVRWHEDCYAVTDSLGFCSFASTALYGITPANMAELFSHATGVDISADDILNAGRRIVTLEKCFNVRQGASRKDDTLPWRLMNESTPDREGARNSKEELDAMLDDYYALHGWDKETSWPTRENLMDLELLDVCSELADLGKLVSKQGPGGSQSGR